MGQRFYESPLHRSLRFAARAGATLPVFMAPMSGASPVSLASAIANAGGMGACGALLMSPQAISSWADEFRQHSSGPFQINLWVPDPPPVRDAAAEERQRAFLGSWGPEIPADAGDTPLQDFEAQCLALLQAKPRVISSIMGLFPPSFVDEMKAQGILWFATATTAAEARAAEAAGADVIVAQGAEAGGHRGAFHAANAEAEAVGLFALLPQVCDAVSLPVIATGGISDGRGIAAALVLGASAVQIGTGFLRTPEAGIHPTYADRLEKTEAHDTRLTRAFSGRTGRAVRTRYVEEAAARGPAPAPYPVQRALTRSMRDEAAAQNDPERMQMWAGQATSLARPLPAATLLQTWWEDALTYLR
ncbi:NAD(P)H-dependent flavin oxidoreductase [Silvibacterium dinghuense]|uniref:Nitronate monooxygenase n=1 Tax=Silvibacterium dinghuense TaxID=1560006 RepID=A0A4Q1S9R2_9BACT|nr:nitronate monooxygenase [Silvibacterium dinghuense]RXS93796.1 nitronate monooxygenase [Silvibacterium dinghuense]GGH07715.1 2-nitropropane dioxygenase [Silvibacterium dinghuense]